MLARLLHLRRPLASAPLRLARGLSSTPQRALNERDDDVSAQEEIDEALEWEEPSESSTPNAASSEFSQLLSASETTLASVPSNGLSYAGLPDHKIFLDLPPAQDPLIRYLASSLLHDGRRHTAERRASHVLLHLHTLTRAEPLPLLRRAVERVMPNVRIARHKHSTKIIEIPVALNEKQQVRYAMKWMLEASEKRGGRTIEERLAREIVLVNLGSSEALRRKEALHGNAMVNRGNIPVGRML